MAFEGFMKKDGFNMSDSDDKPFECTAAGCGQVSIFFSLLVPVKGFFLGELEATGLILKRCRHL